MTTVADLVREPALRRLADQATVALGTRLAARGGVWLDVYNPLRVTATVEDADGEQVELSASPSGLRWTCTCPDGASGVFCAHAVATAVETWRRAAPRRF